MINDQLSLNDQFNQWLALDETTGALGIIYYDTIADPGRLKTDVWYQRSTDGGATWSWAVKVTTAQTDETVAGADFGNQYGDYNGLSANAGILFPSWTDRRNGINEEIWTVKLDETPVAGTLPDAPTIGNATAGNASISVDFTPGALGTGALVNFTANCGGVTAVGDDCADHGHRPHQRKCLHLRCPHHDGRRHECVVGCVQSGHTVHC
jgi:hypothetical protein